MVDKLENVQESASKKGIICEKPVWEPIHQSLRQAECPNSDYAYNHALSIPIYPSLTEQEIKYVTENLGTILKETGEKALAEVEDTHGYTYTSYDRHRARHKTD
jgi:dTDP-4-amino-4,6-dideoxygalactose transaminase